MIGKTMRAACRGAMLLASASVGAVAWAQSLPPGTPRAMTDENGVDLSTGQYSGSPVAIAIGGEKGLSWAPGRGDLTRSGIVLVYNPQTRAYDYFVRLGGEATIFRKSGSSYIPVERNGATLSYASGTQEYTFTNRSGDVLILRNVANTNMPGGQVQIAPVSMKLADGQKLTFVYESTSWLYYGYNPPYSMRTINWSRLARIDSDTGYSLTITYQTNTAGGYVNDRPVAEWSQPAKIELSRTGGCTASATQNCDPAVAWPQIAIAWPSYGVATYTDALGRTTRVTNTIVGSDLSPTAIRFPGSTSDDVAIGYAGNTVASVTQGGVTTAYGFSDAGDTRTVTVTRGSLPARIRTFRISTLQMLSDQWKTDPAGPTHTRSYTYDPATALLTRITEPEGNYTQFAYDERGNVTETRRVSKTPGTPPDLVASATYEPGCANAVTCNQPLTTTDVRGKVTDYVYDPVHGGVTSVKGPAPDPAQLARRPEMRSSYTQLGNGGAPSATGTWMLTGTSACATTISCIGTADEQRTTIGYGYGLDPVTVTQASGSGTVVATTVLTRDRVGNVAAADGPLPGSDDTSRFRYDALRRPVGTVSPDPDGGGALLPRATRTTYNSDGTVQLVEQGTDGTPAATGFGGFTSLQQVNSSYDGYHRKVKDVFTAGGQTFAVAQQSYDALGRIDCTATRMDPAQWSGQSDACVAQTGGPNGPDRVVRRGYDAAGRVVTQTSGYGTAAASTEMTAFTANGQVARVTDGEGNRTSYGYDGFDRLSTTAYPVSTPGQHASNGGDHDQTNYAANGDVTSRQLRDGQVVSYGYDGLGRPVSKNIVNVVYWATDKGFGYDLLGRLTGAWDSNGRSLGFGYDALDRKTGQTDNWYSFGNATFQYDAAGRRTRFTWADGNYVSYDYLVTGETSAIRENGGLALAAFGYDSLGRRTSLTRGNGTVSSYGYDAASRLTALTLSGGNQPNAVALGYNPAGQITSRTASNDAYAWTGHYNVDRGYGVNGLNQLTSAGATALGYDGRGNLTSSGGSAYGYTPDNLLATAPGANLAYDPLDRLFNVNAEAGVNTTLVYDGADVIAELDQNAPGGVIRRYVHGPGADEPLVWYEGAGLSDRRYLHADERGSIVAVTNGQGTALAINRYDEFGIPAAGNLGRFQYTGQKWLPSLGLYDYKARMYSPTLGRFMQTDPIGYGAGLNWYNYVNGDPVNLTDPSGMIPPPSLNCYPGTVWNGYKCVLANEIADEADIVVTGRRQAKVSFDFIDRYSPTPVVGPVQTSVSPQNVSPKVKSFICGTLKNNGYDRDRSARAAYQYRNDPNNPKQRFNPTARYAENWLVAASYNSYYPDLSLNRFKIAIYAWQYLKFVPGIADKNDGFSQEALDAGLDGHEHRYDSPAQLKAMCNAQ